MSNVFDKGEPLYAFAKHKFDGKVFTASSVHNIHDNIDQTVKDWKNTNYSVRVLKVPNKNVQIIYLYEKN